MCDYSLHAFPNRLAKEGEELVIHRFGGGSLGLASPSDICPVVKARQDSSQPRRLWSWQNIKTWFESSHNLPRRPPAVCIPPGASLVVKDIPRGLQRELSVGETEEVTFVQTSANVNTYRDAVRFSNGRQILLQALREGQRVVVVSLDLAENEQAPITVEDEAWLLR